jgi:hypothetical protein
MRSPQHLPTATAKDISGLEYYVRLTGFARRDVYPFFILYAIIVVWAAVKVSNYEWWVRE